MRLRHVKNASILLKASPYYISDIENLRGDFSSCFLNEQPIHLEIGTGKGQFLISMAKKYPNINFIGVEKYESVLVRAIQKCQNESLDNLKFISMDAKFIAPVFQNNIDNLYLNFSDPWPKRRHHERRLTSSSFLTLYDSIFKGNCHIIQKTDNQVLFESSLEDLSKHGYILNKVSLNLHETEIDNVFTEYEEKFASRGQSIYYLEAIKDSNVSGKN